MTYTKNSFLIKQDSLYLQQDALLNQPKWGDRDTAMTFVSPFGAEAIREVVGGEILILDKQGKEQKILSYTINSVNLE